MNRNKEMIVRFCILCGICSATLHKDSYNREKFYEIKNEYKYKNVVQNDSFNKFIAMVNDSRVKMVKDKQIKEQQRKLEIKKRHSKIAKIHRLNRGSIDSYNSVFTCSFYSGLKCENSSLGAVGCKNNKLYDGCVANNVLKYKTKIKLKGWGIVEVLDTGGDNFNSAYNLDIYVPKLNGESNDDYYDRVQKMGVIKVKGKIIN